MGIQGNVRRMAKQQRRIQELVAPLNRIIEQREIMERALAPVAHLGEGSAIADNVMAVNGMLIHEQLERALTPARDVAAQLAEFERIANHAMETQGIVERQQQLEQALAPAREAASRLAEFEHMAQHATEIQGVIERQQQLEQVLAPAREAASRLAEFERMTSQAIENLGPLMEAAQQAENRAIAPIRSATDRFLTVQQAADRLLREFQRPLSARELAESALSRQLVHSSARDPIHSVAQTLEKNVREQLYNNPPLKFVYNGAKRLLALPEWPAESITPTGDYSSTQVVVDVSPALTRDLQLAVQAGLADSVEDAIILFAKRGLSAAATQIKEAVIAKVEQFGSDDSSLV